MAFGNLSQDDKFKHEQSKPSLAGLSGNSADDLEKYNPGFKTMSQNQFGDKAPTEKELEDNKAREIKAPSDRYKNANLKEILKLRGAFLIIAVWILVHFALVVFADGKPDEWFSMLFNPQKMPGFLGVMSQGSSIWGYIAGIVQILLGSIFAPFMFTSWFNFIINAVFLIILCWSAKVVQVDDVRQVANYAICSFGSSLIVYGLCRFVMLSFTITNVSQGTWVEAMQNSNVGIYGLKTGMVGFWIFVTIQVMFERAKIPSYAQGMEEKRGNRTKILILDVVLGVLYCIFMARPGQLPIMPLKVFAIVLVTTSLIIGIVRSLHSYSTLALARQHGRL